MRDTENDFSRFLGDSPIKVLVRLVVISLFVGFLMAMFNLQPLEVVESAVRFIVNVWETGFAAFGEFGRYVVAGATLVVPIWLIRRALSFRRSARIRDRAAAPDND